MCGIPKKKSLTAPLNITKSSMKNRRWERQREENRENRVTGCCCPTEWAGLLSVEWFWWTFTPGCVFTIDVTSTLCGRHGTAMITVAQVSFSLPLSVSQTPSSLTLSKSSTAPSELRMDKSHDFTGKVSNAHRDTHSHYLIR